MVKTRAGTQAADEEFYFRDASGEAEKRYPIADFSREERLSIQKSLRECGRGFNAAYTTLCNKGVREDDATKIAMEVEAVYTVAGTFDHLSFLEPDSYPEPPDEDPMKDLTPDQCQYLFEVFEHKEPNPNEVKIELDFIRVPNAAGICHGISQVLVEKLALRNKTLEDE